MTHKARMLTNTNTNWNKVATDMGLDLGHANMIFESNFNYLGVKGSQYHGVSSNLSQFGSIFQRCHDPETGRIGNRSSQDMLRIAQVHECDWDIKLQWYSRFTTKTTKRRLKTICFLCGKVITKSSDIQSEHILPFTTAVKSGLISNPKNYAPACSACNNLKDNKLSLPEDAHEKVNVIHRKEGDFNDLAEGYMSIMLRTQAITSTKKYPVVIDVDTRVAFVMHRILGGLDDWRLMDVEARELLAKRIEIMDKLANWFMAQKILKNAIVDGNLDQVNTLIEGAENEVRAKYFALKWINTVNGNMTVSELQATLDEKDARISQLESQLNEQTGTTQQKSSGGGWIMSCWNRMTKWYTTKRSFKG